MLIEVKSNQKAYQKATKQLFDGFEGLKEVFGELGITTLWLYVGVFISLSGNEFPLFDCSNCSIFALVGKESISSNFKLIEEYVVRRQENIWRPGDHVKEFVELAKEMLFIAQGDPYAPVTQSNLIDKTSQHIDLAGSAKSVFFWTNEQLPIIHACQTIQFLVLDAFYSTGKSEVLRYFGRDKLEKGDVVHYFNQRPVGLKAQTSPLWSLLPFTLMLQTKFPTGVVKETTFQFGADSVQGFLEDYGIEPSHHLIFDEVICTRYNTKFLESLVQMKNGVGSLWIAMGAEPITGEIYLDKIFHL